MTTTHYDQPRRTPLAGWLPFIRHYAEMVLAMAIGMVALHPLWTFALQAAGVPHLLAEVHETTAVLGPFVHPGRTSCLGCRDLHRTEGDPGWPRPPAGPTPTAASARTCPRPSRAPSRRSAG